MAITKYKTYPLDVSGTAPTNLVRNELHTITAENRDQSRILIPSYAPYFRRSLIVTVRSTGVQLVEDIDYTCEYRGNGQQHMEDYSPIYGGIRFLDPELTGEFSLTYQTIGGEASINGINAAKALMNKANDRPDVTWQELVGKPLDFPAIEHVHSAKDLVGFDDVNHSLIEIKEALISLHREDRESSPGYQTLIDEYFRLGEVIDRISKQYEQVIAQAGSNNNDEAIAQLRQELANLSASVGENTKQQLKTLQNELKAVKASIPAAKTEMRNELTTKAAELAAQITAQQQANDTAVEAAKRELNTKIDGAKQQAENQVNAAKNGLADQIKKQKAALDESLKQLKQQVTSLETALDAKIAKNKADITAESNKVKGHDNRIQALERRINEVTGQVNASQSNASQADVNRISGEVTKLTNQLQTVNNNISTLTSTVNGLKTKINTLETKVNSFEARIRELEAWKNSFHIEFEGSVG